MVEHEAPPPPTGPPEKRAATEATVNSSAASLSAGTADSKEKKWSMNGASYATADECERAVKKAKSEGKAGYWKQWNVVKDAEDNVKLECKDCKALMSCANPAMRGKSHFAKTGSNT